MRLSINMDNVIIVIFSVIVSVRAEIIKPWGEWLCNYCAMGNNNIIIIIIMFDHLYSL